MKHAVHKIKHTLGFGKSSCEVCWPKKASAKTSAKKSVSKKKKSKKKPKAKKRKKR
ncbi:MAG: hypothetical protein ACE5DI_02415 [Candidatus Micrarchaeia archaeon]